MIVGLAVGALSFTDYSYIQNSGDQTFSKRKFLRTSSDGA